MTSEPVTPELEQFVLASTAAACITGKQELQSLWSGYGQIIRYNLEHPEIATVIVKQVDPPPQPTHPRGWNTDASLQRKLDSYMVETHWYQHYAAHCPSSCKVPQLIAHQSRGTRLWLVLEDLDQQFPARHQFLTAEACIPCLLWLACFHAQHFQSQGSGLWPTGTYWHLGTRQDEYAAMRPGPLKNAAAALDSKLQQCEFKTLVHGDAKLANFCFSANGQSVAMVDFQYAGVGCGIRDVAYFLGSCLDEHACERDANALQDIYFNALVKRLPADLARQVEAEWRSLYAVAWADFHRFLAGWMPGHKKIHRYTEEMTRQALGML